MTVTEPVDFDVWLAACGIVPESLNAEQTTALRAKWRRENLMDLRESRPSAPAPLRERAGQSAQASLLEAGLLIHCGAPLSQVAKHYGPQVTDAATARGYRSVGLQDLLKATLAAAGRHV